MIHQSTKTKTQVLQHDNKRARYFPLLGREGIHNALGEWLCNHIQRGVCFKKNSCVLSPYYTNAKYRFLLIHKVL